MIRKEFLGMALFLVALPALAGTITAPSSSESPYVVPSMHGVVVKSILTVGDAVAGYRLAGLPDGLGAFDNGDGTFTLLMNHEIREARGAVRAHGAQGAFVSKWTIAKDDLRVVAGEDLIRQVATWNRVTNSYDAPAAGVTISRLCSADLAATAAYYDASTGSGFAGHLFLSGEESGAEGRAFAHGLDGTSWELPRLGRYSYENAVASPAAGAKSVVIGLDDTAGGQVYVYVGTKQTGGSAIDRAGLTNGVLYGVRVAGAPAEDPATGIESGTRFELVPFGNADSLSGAALDAASVAAGVTGFQRPEDGHFDPRDARDFYFVTTASFATRSRLWRLRFDDASDPARGGSIDMLLDGSEGQHMLDNMTVTKRGQILLQEDPGSQPYLARVWRYDIARDALCEIAHHDPARFTAGAEGFLTQDEESSGIIDVSEILGEGWFLGDVQAHYTNADADLVEGGQLFAIHVPPGKK